VKLLFVSHCFEPAKDGGAVLFSGLSLGAARAGHQVEVITSNCYSTDDFINPRPRLIYPFWQKQERLIVNRLSVFTRGRLLFRLGEIICRGGIFSLFKTGPVFSNLGVINQKRELDWVIAGPFPTAAVFWGWLIAKRNRAKLALIPCYHFGERSYENYFLWSVLRKAEKIFCLSDYEKKCYERRGLASCRLALTGGMVTDLLLRYRPDRAGQFPRTPTVLYLGTKAAHKRVEILLEAVKILWRSKKDIRLIIAGPETLSSFALKEKIARLPLSWRKKVIYKGKVTEEEKIDFLDRASVLVNPSQYESFGIVFTEAWARKKPVIGAKIPALQQLIKEGRTGLFFFPNNPADLAKQIALLVQNHSLAKKMGEKGYNSLRRYRPQRVVAEFLAALKK